MHNPSPLQFGCYYHLYNRGNNRENLFLHERNYRYFMDLYAKYVEPVADTYAFCLLKNHFHFLVRIKQVEELNTQNQPQEPSQAFSNLFNAYAKSFNRAYQRTGALFQRPFGRIPVTSPAYFLRLVAYIHQNPQKHGFVDDFRDWPYSSYSWILSDKPSRVKREELLDWFGSREGFVEFHRQVVKETEISSLLPEDEVVD
jgi:putative transposase